MRTRARDSAVMDQMGRYEKTVRSDSPRERVCDQSYIKQYNIQSVLAILKQCQPISRTDIARKTGMSPTSITRIVTALINQGLIYETSGEQRSGRGRKATHLRVNEEGLYSIGIHLEKSVIRLCVMNFADEVLYRGETIVDGEGTPEKLAEMARGLYDRIPEGIIRDQGRVQAVGVCLSGAVNKCKGVVTHSIQLEWDNVDLRNCFSEAFGITACIENDVKACLIGEKVRMSISEEVDTVYLLAGKGIGMAATSGGSLIRGMKNEAGEIAHLPIGYLPNGELDYLADHLRERQLIRRAREFDPGIHSVDAILWAAQQGYEWAKGIIEDFRKHLELAVLIIEGIYSPARIVLGGTVCHKLHPEISKSMGREHVRLGDRYEESCMTGAALVAMRSAVVEMIGHSIE